MLDFACQRGYNDLPNAASLIECLLQARSDEYGYSLQYRVQLLVAGSEAKATDRWRFRIKSRLRQAANARGSHFSSPGLQAGCCVLALSLDPLSVRAFSGSRRALAPATSSTIDPARRRWVHA